MKTCPECGRNFPDEYGFCLDDGSTLSQPLEGEKTELIKGPFDAGCTTEVLSLAAGSDPTFAAPVGRFEPAPTEAALLKTIKSYKTPQYETQTASSGPAATQSTAAWILVALLLTVVTGGTIFYFDNQRQPANGANNTRVEADASSADPAVSPQATKAQPARNASARTIIAVGVTEAETTDEYLVAQQKRGYVIHWNVGKGDLYEPCGPRGLGRATVAYDVPQVGGGTIETQTDVDLTWTSAVIVKGLDVSTNENYFFGQRLAVLGKIMHIWVNATVQPSDAGDISQGMQAVFTDPQAKRSYKGLVYSIDAQTGKIRIQINDSEAFSASDSHCLSILPNRTGEVRLTSPAAGH